MMGWVVPDDGLGLTRNVLFVATSRSTWDNSARNILSRAMRNVAFHVVLWANTLPSHCSSAS
jgi:hypothetical protein